MIELNQLTSYRNTWTLQYAAGVISEAAGRKEDFHRNRQKHWGTESDRLYEEYKKSAQVAEVPRGAVRRGGRPGGRAMESAAVYATANFIPENIGRETIVTTDENIKALLEDAEEKFLHHKRTADVFKNFRIALGTEENKSTPLALTVDDVIFFGLGGWNTTEELEKDV